MVHLINKDALVAEIEKRKDIYKRHRLFSRKDECDAILSFIDTFEAKEVDLEKELDEWMKYGPHTNYPWCTIPDAIKITAEHFFELGLKAQKGE